MNNEIKVLLVDDHAIMRKGLLLLLSEEADITVVGEAEDGEQAIERVRALQPDVVVMDFRMPFMDGLEATARITESWPHVKVIIHSMTGVSQQAGKAVGAREVLHPYDSMKRLQTAVLNA